MNAPIPIDGPAGFNELEVQGLCDVARETLDTIELTITSVIDLSMENIDYGNAELNGKVMETLHRLRMSHEALRKALEAAE